MTVTVRLEFLLGRRRLVPVLWLPLIGFLLAMGLVAALGRDLDGRYAGSPLKRWFDQLESGWGRCCADADGHIVEDADWDRQLSCLPAKLTRSIKVYINDDGWPADVRHPMVRRDFAV